MGDASQIRRGGSGLRADIQIPDAGDIAGKRPLLHGLLGGLNLRQPDDHIALPIVGRGVQAIVFWLPGGSQIPGVGKAGHLVFPSGGAAGKNRRRHQDGERRRSGFCICVFHIAASLLSVQYDPSTVFFQLQYSPCFAK